MAFAEAFLVGAQDQRHVRELRHRRAHRLVQQHLLRCIRDVVIAAHHLRHLHLHIVNNDREVVGRVRVGTNDDKVFDVGVVELDAAVHEVVERRRARGHQEANGVRFAGGDTTRDLVGGQSGAAAVVVPRLPCGFRGGALSLQIVGFAEAAVRVA